MEVKNPYYHYMLDFTHVLKENLNRKDKIPTIQKIVLVAAAPFVYLFYAFSAVFYEICKKLKGVKDGNTTENPVVLQEFNFNIKEYSENIIEYFKKNVDIAEFFSSDKKVEAIKWFIKVDLENQIKWFEFDLKTSDSVLNSQKLLFLVKNPLETIRIWLQKNCNKKGVTITSNMFCLCDPQLFHAFIEIKYKETGNSNSKDSYSHKSMDEEIRRFREQSKLSV